MRRLTALTAGCLLCLSSVASELPVRDWTSPGLELSAGRGAIALRGHVASSAHLSELRDAAGPHALSAEQAYKHIVLPEHWRASSSLLVKLLADMHSGDAAMTRDEIVLRGTMADGDAHDALESALRQNVPPSMAVKVDVWIAPGHSGACDTLLQTLLDGSFRLRAGAVDVSGEHFPRLNRIADALERCREVRLRITGHTDNTGDADDNRRISEQRARAYVDYLAGQGVAEDRLLWEGLGSAEPVGNNRSAAGRSRNRRVAIEIYSAP